MSRENAARRAEIGMQNLARLVGYPHALRRVLVREGVMESGSVRVRWVPRSNP